MLPEAARALPGVTDNPIGEGVPKGSLADGETDLLDEDKESSSPEGDAMNLAHGPVVVGDEEKQKALSEQGVDANMPSAEGDRPARDGSDHKGSAGEIDVALMRRRITAVAEGGIDERGEEDHVGQRNYVEGFWVAA